MAVSDIEAELERLTAAVADCKRRLQEAREEDAGIKVGDMVTAMGNTYKVVNVEFMPFGDWRPAIKPWVSGVTKTKRGKWSKNIRNLYADWTKLP